MLLRSRLMVLKAGGREDDLGGARNIVREFMRKETAKGSTPMFDEDDTCFEYQGYEVKRSLLQSTGISMDSSR